jgi:hypothetical protein
MGHRRAVRGDSLPSIAAAEGHPDWRAVWEHPENASLRERRKSPHVLAAGDVVFVPDKTQAEKRVASGSRHRFTVRGATVALKLTLRDRKGSPIANKPFELAVGGVTRTGTTNGDGYLEVRVPVTSREGTLKIAGVTFPIAVGHLDPVDEPSGLQQRLRNLGLLPHASPTAAQIEDALRWFQKVNDLPESGTADAATRDKLLEKHKA